MFFDPEWVGMGAAFCTTVAFLPQTIKVLRDKDTRAISLGMYSIFSLGVTLWMSYGFLIGNYTIAISNVCVVAMSYTILFMKIRLG